MSDTLIQCAMNGRLYRDSSLGIWDDGEWVSWDYINSHIAELEDKAHYQRTYPHASMQLAQLFESLVEHASAYRELTGRHLEIWGELGELYAEVVLGLKRHPAYHMGTDGVLDGQETEIKTLSPMRRSDVVRVKAAGGFERLMVIRISENYDFEARRFPRSCLQGEGLLLRAHWGEGEPMTGSIRHESSREERLLDLLKSLRPEEWDDYEEWRSDE